MGYNAIEIDGEVKLDLSQDTVTEETLPEGVTAHNADGDPIEGKMKFVKSINGKDGDVTLGAEDVGARPDTWTPSAEDVGARPNTWMPSASDVGARPNTWMPSYSDVNADKAGTAQSLVSGHNTNTDAHNDIRLELKALADRINAALDSDDTTLDELSEIVAYIKANKALIDSITTSKVNVADIIDNLTTNVTNKPLSAAQGVALKALIDALDTDKLDASALISAINTALAQAKASGAFDGADGKNGKDGEDYVLTDADKEEIVAEMLTALGTPMAGTVDEDNNIILGGELPDGTYTLKYYNQGEYIEIGKLVVSGGSGEAEIKNWINFGTTELGGTEIYNGKGWKENTRWSASSNAPAAKDGMYLTGIIPVTEGDRVYTYDMPWVSSLSETAYWARYYANGNIDEVAVYGNFTPDENNVYEFVIPADVLGVRFSCFGISETSMITVNKKPIE